MKQEAAEELRDALEMEGYDATIHDDYSGRGMYGKTTYSVTSDVDPSTAMFIAGQEGLRKPTVDNMGLGYVYY